jgi:hypothetical protein
MGGYGSGWRGAKRDVVDHCVVLSIKELIRARALVPDSYKRGTLVWGYGESESCLSFEYESELRLDGTGSLFLRYIAPRSSICLRARPNLQAGRRMI